MDGIYLTDDELWALSRCSGVAVKAYLRLRSRMDLRTGIVGLRSGVSYKMVQEWAAQSVEKGGGEVDETPTYKQARVAVAQLVRRGLLERVPTVNDARLLVFKCPMARMPEIRSKRTGHEQGIAKQAEQGTEQGTNRADLKASSGAGFVGVDGCEQGTEQGTNRAEQKWPNRADIGEGVNPYLSQAAYTTVNGVDAVEAVAAVGLAMVSRASPEPVQADRRREVDLVLTARQHGANVTASDPRVMRWAEQGVTPRQMEQACAIARQRREAEGSRQAVNAGYLDAILRDVLNPPERKTAVAWWADDCSMDAKARELGIALARPGESRDDYKARIRAAALQAEARQA